MAMDNFIKVVTSSGYVAFQGESDERIKDGIFYVMDPNIAMDFARRLAVMAREAGATNISEEFRGGIDEELFRP